MDAKLRPLLETVVAEGKLPAIGAIVTNANGDVLLKETCGTDNVALADAPKFDADTLMPIASCTKLVASIAALQLVEDGKLSLSDSAEQYVPGIAKLEVLESFTDDDPPKPILRKPKTSPTIQQLLNHTMGTAYDFFDTKTLKWRLSTDRAPSQ